MADVRGAVKFACPLLRASSARPRRPPVGATVRFSERRTCCGRVVALDRLPRVAKSNRFGVLLGDLRSTCRCRYHSSPPWPSGCPITVGSSMAIAGRLAVAIIGGNFAVAIAIDPSPTSEMGAAARQHPPSRAPIFRRRVSRGLSCGTRGRPLPLSTRLTPCDTIGSAVRTTYLPEHSGRSSLRSSAARRRFRRPRSCSWA